MAGVCRLLTGQQRGVPVPGWLSKHTRRWVGWLWVPFLLGLVPVSVLAEGRGSIRGLMLRDGQEIAEHRIMLIRLGPNRDVQRTPGQTDAQGQFIFDNLETGELFEYVIGIRYAGQLYQSEPMRLEPGQHRTGVVVEVRTSSTHTVGEVSPQPLLQITNHLMVIVFRGEHLEVQEVVRILNQGPMSSMGTSAETGAGGFSLRLPLPQGYYNFDVQGLTPEHVRLYGSGWYYTASLTTGEHRVVYTYALPLQNDMVTILAERTLPTALLDTLVEDTYLVAASDLQFGGRVAIEPHTFFHFRGTDLAAHTRSWLQLTRRTEPPHLLRVGAYSLIICMALLGIGLPLYGAWHSRGQQEHAASITPEQLQELHAERIRLLQTIARLDDQRETGMIEDGVYQQRRHAYKKQLVALIEQLQQAQRDKQGIN